MGEIRRNYSASTSLTITIAGLANNASRSSTVVDNSSALALDAEVFLDITAGAASTSSVGTVIIYAYGSTNGTDYTASVSGTDSAHTATGNEPVIMVVSLKADNQRIHVGPRAIAGVFGGVLPHKWGLIVENRSGGTLAAGTAIYRHIKLETA